MANYGSGTFDLVGVIGFPVTATVDPGSTTTFNLVGVIDTFNISSSKGSTVTINNTINAASTLNLDTNGGAIEIGTLAGALGPVDVQIDQGGSFTAGGTVLGLLNNGNITYANGGGTAVLGTANDFINLSFAPVFHGFDSSSDVIDDRSLNFSGLGNYTISGSGTQTITIHDSSGNFTFSVAGNLFPAGTFSIGSGPLTFTADGTGGTDISVVCFLAGTHIATRTGEAKIESLRVGDAVAVKESGQTAFRPIAWIGRGHMDVSRSMTRRDAYPVRVRAGAFGEKVPHRDLLMTSEHCVHVDGRLVPVRMLVNGSSILADSNVTRYEYFHLELEHHSILIAEGLEAESYLDTGNRRNFANSSVAALVPEFAIDVSHRRWSEDAAAPLTVDRETVEPIWNRLAERARELGWKSVAVPKVLTEDPDLHLVTESGVEIRPSLVDGRVYTFAVPGGVRALRLVSKASRPADAIGPYLDDRRVLGVLVSRIDLRMGRNKVADGMPAMGTGTGWHAAEPNSPHRWTNGNAFVPVDLQVLDGRPALLDVEVIQAGPYLLRDPSGSLAA